MKKLIFTVSGLIIGFNILAQLTLSKSFDFSANITKINTSDYKYYLMDVPTSQCRIYNPDFSLYQAINLAIPAGEWLYDVRFVSEDLFNDDTKLEMLYTFYKWVVTDQITGDGYYVYHSRVVNEDGLVLLDVPGALYSYVKETGTDEFSLFLYVYDYSLNPYSIKTNIYRLPGKLNYIDDLKKGGYSLQCYPNPNQDILTIDFSLPYGLESSDLQIIDSKGKKILTYHLTGNSGKFQLPGEDLIPGLYYFILENNGQRSEVEKVVVQ
jgi:hypothetical protein